MGLVRLRLRVADAAFDDSLVNGVRLGRLFRHEAQPYKQPLDRSKHRGFFLWLSGYFFFTGSSSSRRILRWRMYANCVSSCFSSEAPTTVAPSFFTPSNTLASTSNATKCTAKVVCFCSACRLSVGIISAGGFPAVFLPSVMINKI